VYLLKKISTSKYTMPEKKYKKKTHPYLDSIVDAIDNTPQKKYDIKRLLKRYRDALQKEADKLFDEGKDEEAMNIKPKNNLHIMFEECKKLKIGYNGIKKRCDKLLTLNAMLEDENKELKEKLAKYESQSTESVNL